MDKCGALTMKKGRKVEWEKLVRLQKKAISTLVFWIYVKDINIEKR